MTRRAIAEPRLELDPGRHRCAVGAVRSGVHGHRHSGVRQRAGVAASAGQGTVLAVGSVRILPAPDRRDRRRLPRALTQVVIA